MKSHLDFLREAYDDASRKLISQMRSRIRKRADHATPEMEDTHHFLPEALEQWTNNYPEFSHRDFEVSEYALYAIIDWKDDKNKSKIWFDAYPLLRSEEEKALAAWRK